MSRNEIYGEYGETIFSRISRLADEHGAVDLGQGFPGYSPPDALLKKLREVPADASNHQYAPSAGVLDLRRELSELTEQLHDLNYHPEAEITVTGGATEAINAAMMGLLNPGDEVVVFEPVYDQYVPVARRAGADVTVLSLREEDFALPVDEIKSTVTDATDLIVLNNPHNPTGRVFERQRLEELVAVARTHDVTLLSDEVYEHLFFEDTEFRSLSTFDGARERTIRLGSAGKTLDATGWKVGWAMGPRDLTESLRLAHQFTTFCATTLVQVALASFFRDENLANYFQEFREAYEHRRRLLIDGLNGTPFRLKQNSGTYFLVGEYVGEQSFEEGDFTEWMIREVGVATIPMRAFYRGESPENPMVRFAFCKREEEIREALDRIRTYFEV